MKVLGGMMVARAGPTGRYGGMVAADLGGLLGLVFGGRTGNYPSGGSIGDVLAQAGVGQINWRAAGTVPGCSMA